MPSDVLSGTRIDDFTIAHRIARGMTCDVFAVWHHDLLTPLVCKRLRAEEARHDKPRELLQREAAALRRLAHPGVVRLIDARLDAGTPYILLEHVGERTVRDDLKRAGKFPVDVAVRIVQHVGASVAYAHRHKLLHRDLKTSNLMMRGGRPVLLDFGIVWDFSTGDAPPDRSGTPSRLAPEQIRREPLDRRTDIYGLGILLFEMLTARRLFKRGSKEPNATLVERYPQLVAKPRTLRRAGLIDATPALEKIVAQCLAFDPRDRFASVGDLLVALDGLTRVKIYPRAWCDRRTAFKS